MRLISLGHIKNVVIEVSKLRYLKIFAHKEIMSSLREASEYNIIMGSLRSAGIDTAEFEEIYRLGGIDALRRAADRTLEYSKVGKKFSLKI